MTARRLVLPGWQHQRRTGLRCPGPQINTPALGVLHRLVG